MLDAGPSSSIGDDLDRLEDILPSEPVDLSDWLEPPTLQSRVPSLKVEDLLVDTGPIAAYERLRISFLQQDAHRVDENHETGDKEYIYTNQRPFKVVLQAQGANGGPLPIDNLHLTVRLMLESGSDVRPPTHAPTRRPVPPHSTAPPPHLPRPSRCVPRRPGGGRVQAARRAWPAPDRRYARGCRQRRRRRHPARELRRERRCE